MALCLNPQCQKRVADTSSDCPYCGGIEISKFDSYSKSELLKDELSMENFEKVINKAKEACKNAGEEISDHFPDVRKVIEAGKGAKHRIKRVVNGL